jgi:hypothetical protein
MKQLAVADEKISRPPAIRPAKTFWLASAGNFPHLFQPRE